MRIARKIIIKGRVQGVGFRPFIFQIAHEFNIVGTVQNNMDGVNIHAEAESNNMLTFIQSIKNKSPRLSRIDNISYFETDLFGYNSFNIIDSERSGASSLVIPIDSAVCDECLSEMFDPTDNRYMYPFINCTQCGPRYTIISELPYDRPYTSMAAFELCDNCRNEYENPYDRRHHAQPIACSTCGPTLKLLNVNTETVIEEGDVLQNVIEKLKEGAVVAIKGLGGYHLACDATNEQAVQLLRQRKNRPNRPLAIMAKHIKAVKEIVVLTEKENKILKSPESPIVVMKKENPSLLADSIAPHMSTLGVMLPYTPLHHLLFHNSGIQYLVMTSANPSGLPILYKDAEALRYLANIADYILTHDRPILHPVDDSVVQIQEENPHFFRRARGYVPDPIITSSDVHRIVALGSQQKNTFAFGRHEQIFIGPHIGELSNVEVVDHFLQEYEHLKTWMGIMPTLAVVDSHPHYETWYIARELNLPTISVQHHHAHMVSCMEDNNLKDKSYGIILDGTGYGDDGCIWGFEVLLGDASEYTRLAHLKYTPLPSGEQAIKEPWRNAVGMLISLLPDGASLAESVFPTKKQQIQVLKNMIDKKLQTPYAGTCGRLFDAISAILQLCEKATYDGEPAIRLAEIVDDSRVYSAYPFEIETEEQSLVINFANALKHIVHDSLKGRNCAEIAGDFHETIVVAIVEVLKQMYKKVADCNNVVLSGGSFHNNYLTKRLKYELTKLGYKVFEHQKVPCNDGGLSLGQLIIAANQRRKDACV
ncbi:carbamoyltransferase HypF [Bacillus sp. HMF5848]|uniref:carbamoyltransferase HypF n=1 Tax=Bacillus sp. HMF5848 TaxID=2495421 RepID=UPI000F7A80FC|nr:carbamoyltransferase HypF [Bacillus sp. HMF5848]RSK27291.1 carbamoyltransferase HypF [Bacillus sp. HMF5848]